MPRPALEFALVGESAAEHQGAALSPLFLLKQSRRRGPALEFARHSYQWQMIKLITVDNL